MKSLISDALIRGHGSDNSRPASQALLPSDITLACLLLIFHRLSTFLLLWPSCSHYLDLVSSRTLTVHVFIILTLYFKKISYLSLNPLQCSVLFDCIMILLKKWNPLIPFSLSQYLWAELIFVLKDFVSNKFNWWLAVFWYYLKTTRKCCCMLIKFPHRCNKPHQLTEYLKHHRAHIRILPSLVGSNNMSPHRDVLFYHLIYIIFTLPIHHCHVIFQHVILAHIIFILIRNFVSNFNMH